MLRFLALYCAKKVTQKVTALSSQHIFTGSVHTSLVFFFFFVKSFASEVVTPPPPSPPASGSRCDLHPRLERFVCCVGLTPHYFAIDSRTARCFFPYAWKASDRAEQSSTENARRLSFFKKGGFLLGKIKPVRNVKYCNLALAPAAKSFVYRSSSSIAVTRGRGGHHSPESSAGVDRRSSSWRHSTNV